jgi:small-conductance mechanosensitive channel
MLANYSKGFQFIWNEIPVLITFESNWKKCKEILLEIANQHAEHLTDRAAKRVREASAKMMVFYTTLTPTVYTSVKDCGVLLTIRYLCKPRKRRGTEQEIWEDVLTRFAECDDIDFAYPTIRRYNNPLEGKPGARADKKSIPPEPDDNIED